MTRGLPKPGTVDVLFVAYGGGHVQAVLPVAERLYQSGVSVCVLALTTAIGPVEAAGLPFFTYADLPVAAEPHIQALGKKLSNDLPPGNALPPGETIAYLGLNQADLIKEQGDDAAARLWDEGGRQHFFPINTMVDLMTTLRPKVVMATNSPRSERAAVQAASQLDIPALCLIDLFGLHAVDWIAPSDFGRKVLVLNDSVADFIASHGRPKSDIVVTGNPAFDRLAAPEVMDSGQALRRARGWDGARRTVLYASSPEPARHPFTGAPGNPEFPGHIEEVLRRFVATDDGFELVVRRHPSEPQDVAPGRNVHVSGRADDINALLHAVDVVVVSCSTVGLQAHLIGKPMLSVQGSLFSDDAPFAEMGIGQAIDRPEDLGAALQALDLAPDAAVPTHAGHATEAVCREIMALLR